MNTIVRLMMLVSLLLVVAAPSQAESGEVWHIYQCQTMDETSEDQIIELIEKWVDAAKSIKGSEKVEVHVLFPVASQMGESDFKLLVKSPSFAEWGAVWDAYDDSPAADVEDTWTQMFDCPDSWLFEGFKVEGIETEEE